jgi:hypothetical protein
MTDESPVKRGDAAWKEQRDAVQRRNAEAQRRGQQEKQSRASVVAAAARDDVHREAEQLRELNARIAKHDLGS